jgi:hypothetical protein
LIADVLELRGVEVIHIMDETQAKRHSIAPPAHIVNGRLSYAGPALDSQ